MRRVEAERRAGSTSRELVPVGKVVDESPDPASPAASTPPADPSAAFNAQMMGQTGQRRGLKGGPPVLEAARASYLETEYSGEVAQIVHMVKRDWFAVIGLTAGSDGQLPAMKSAVAQIRKHSQNADIGVMVGGPMFTQDPQLVVAMGADATAPNAPAAVLAAQKLFDIAAQNWRSSAA